VRVTVVRPAELGPSEAAVWQKFQQASPVTAHPCLSLSYARAQARKDGGTRVAIAEDDGEITAFLPYRLDRHRMAVPLAGGSGLEGLVCPIGRPINVRALVRKAGLRGYRFYHAPMEQVALAPHRYLYNYHGTTTYVADLSAGHDAYLRALGPSVSKRISRTKTYRRALERKVGPVVFEWNSYSPDYVRLLIDWKSQQFDTARRMFAEPGALALVEELATSANDDCRGVMSVLRVADRPVAIVLGLQAGSLLAPAILAYDTEFSRFSPGMIEWLALINDAPGHGVTRIDFGWGVETYKRWFGNTSYQASGGGVWVSRAEAAARWAYRQTFYRG
jgi:CelD/BcsL family acetyltransferase involved in cellulose biosynthesis